MKFSVTYTPLHKNKFPYEDFFLEGTYLDLEIEHKG